MCKNLRKKQTGTIQKLNEDETIKKLDKPERDDIIARKRAFIDKKKSNLQKSENIIQRIRGIHTKMKPVVFSKYSETLDIEGGQAKPEELADHIHNLVLCERLF
mmetsp:Transcript_40874/g.62296  ORF Transcript_40874/g.62296 Transcript_40874/m.62296 type:complete len:104 (+) Transcript_40874:174-485(+)